MNTINWNELEEFEIISGLFGKFYHTENMSIVRWRFEAGAELPNHNHYHEQVTMILDGELELIIGDEKYKLISGDLMTIAPDIPHGGKAVKPTIAIDIFNPVRQDFVDKYS